MFGGPVPRPPKQEQHTKRFTQDILMPSIHLGHAHLGRDPNTDFLAKKLHFKQRDKELSREGVSDDVLEMKKTEVMVNFVSHTESRFWNGEIKKKVQQKLAQHEAELDKKREELRQLLADEEREYIWETLDNAQRGQEKKLDQMRQRSRELKAKTEAERVETVKEKKLLQYLDKSLELRPVLEKKAILESKKAQLQQMRENEAKRESERELDQFWYQVMMKEIRAKMEREEQEEIDRHNRYRQQMDVIEQQRAGQRLLQQEQARLAEEDRIEIQKMQDKMAEEERQARINKEKKRQKTAEELKKQLEESAAMQKARKDEEQALENAFNLLAQLEIEKEKAKVKDETNMIKRENALYRENLRQLETERQRDEVQLFEFLEEHRMKIQKVEDDKKCKQEMAKRELEKMVVRERQQQVEDNKKRQQEEWEQVQRENQALRTAIETNTLLDAEARRKVHLDKLQYRDDLQKQIEYTNLLKRREAEELLRQEELSKKEEEYYSKKIKEICTGEIQYGGTHPFRRVFERYDCHCKKPSLKPKY